MPRAKDGRQSCPPHWDLRHWPRAPETEATETEHVISSLRWNLDGLEVPIIRCRHERRSSRVRLCMHIGPF